MSQQYCIKIFSSLLGAHKITIGYDYDEGNDDDNEGDDDAYDNDDKDNNDKMQLIYRNMGW
jgi:hypothetical protein